MSADVLLESDVPREQRTDINIVLDRSGSMSSVRNDTIGGFNSFLNDQKQVPGEATLTLVQFDHEYQIIYDGLNIQHVPALSNATYVPRGATALLDAIGKTIEAASERIAHMPDEIRPGKVIFVIITDGQENSSTKFTKAQITELIKQRTENQNWNFVFLGANQDAIQEGAAIGVMAGNAMTYDSTAVGTQMAYRSISSSMAAYRTSADTRTENFFADQHTQEENDD